MEPDEDDEPIRGEVRLVGFDRVSHGLFRKIKEDLTDEQRRVRELEAWLLVLPPKARFTHITAAALLGWQLPTLPEQVPVFAAVEGDAKRPRRPGLLCSRLRRTGEPLVEPFVRHGLPLDSPEEILLRASRDLGTLDLVVMIDSARRLNHIDEDRMTGLLASTRPGVRKLRAAWELSDARADSAGESLLRVYHRAIEVPVRSQAEIYDASGHLVAKADLLVVGTTMLHEYDGAVHRGRKQHTSDLRRERGLGSTPYTRRGFTLDDLLNHALVVMHEIDRALDRPHELARLSRWRTLVDHSLYAEAGRRRVMNRWARQMGVTDWSRTA